MEETPALYVRGFNHGYTLAKYLPDLVSKLVKQLSPKNDYLSGFLNGKEEYEIEISLTQLDELKQLRNQFKDRDKDIER